MAQDVSKLTGAERQRISRTAKRNFRSEVMLILTAGFALIMVMLFVLGNRLVLPMSELLQIRPMIVWVALRMTLSVVWALAHGFCVKPKIENARELDAAVLHHYQKLRREELQNRLRS
ncbi:hypothetical protein [Shimia sp. MIT910701]|uniref:hypothetical protein n=1 Tax=Shimia sp. MIT910701 TaxID=3096987 RepID=UPI00399A52BB